MAKVRRCDRPWIFPVLGQPNLNIKVDREKAARYGLNAGDINNVVQAALGGTVATMLLEADRQFNVTVRLAPQYREASILSAKSKSAIKRQVATNAYMPLSDLPESPSIPVLLTFITNTMSATSR